MHRADIQALVAALIALDVAAIAGFLVFYGQAVSRFGPRLASALWRSVHVRVPAVIAGLLTLSALVLWARVPVVGHLGSRWNGPAIVAAQILACAWMAWFMIRMVLVGRLPSRCVEKLRRSSFRRWPDTDDSKQLFLASERERRGVGEPNPIELFRPGAKPPVPPSRWRRFWVWCSSRIKWWWIVLITAPEAPDDVIAEYTRTALDNGDLAGLTRFSRAVRARAEVLDSAPGGGWFRVGSASATGLGLANHAAINTTICLVQLIGCCGANDQTKRFRDDTLAIKLLDLARVRVDQTRILNAVIEAFEIIGNGGAYESAGHALRDIGQDLIEHPPPPRRVGDYGSRVPQDSLALVLEAIEGLGGDEPEDPGDAWMARVLAYDVLSGAFPNGQRSFDERCNFAWRIADLVANAAKAGVRSAGHAAFNAGRYLQDFPADQLPENDADVCARAASGRRDRDHRSR